MTTNAPGKPSWVDLGTPDVAAATTFYAKLFGWDAQVSVEPEAGGYTLFRKDGKQVAGVGPLQSEEQPTVWTTYVATADVDASAAAVESAGGVVLMPPMDVLHYGRMGIFADPAGAAFGVWQAGSHSGGEVFNAPGTMTWNELTTREVDLSKAFYSSVFGWTYDDAGMGGFNYSTIKLDDASAGGIMPMVGEDWPADLPPHWMVYFAVEDCDASAALAGELGGTVSVPPTDTPPGRLAVLTDPQGAFFSIIALNPDVRP
jgi:hypothetical protein